MNVEPVHQLAVGLHSSPKLFACLLGSGISRSAGIRTGWEIVLNLVARHAAQLGEDAASADPARWYETKYGAEPDYSEVVAKLAPRPELRRNLLESYFTVLDEATQQRQEHAPTPAHHAIARLVRRGLLRVIVTTNFDRLMERALREAGVAHVEVVSSESAAAACYPFHAAEAFVLKIHGDWRDVWLLNSRAELETYPSSLGSLLRRIVDEHAWIVCGWSAEYDVALRTAIAARVRRFPVHWVDPRPGAKSLAFAKELDATIVAATGDEFFTELETAVGALDRERPPPQLTADVLVARARRHIADRREMELEDLVHSATRQLSGWIDDELKIPTAGDLLHVNPLTRIEEIALTCEQRCVPLARLLTTLARYDQPASQAIHSLSSLLLAGARRPEVQRRPDEGWWWFAGYPALLCAFAYGAAAAAKENWSSAVAAARDVGCEHDDVEFHLPFAPQLELSGIAGVRASDFSARKLGERLSDWSFALVQDWIARRSEFDEAFDRFDVLLAIASSEHPATSERWTPLCTFSKHSADGPSRFERVHAWLANALDRNRPGQGAAAEALQAVFPDSARGYDGKMKLVSRWAKPK